MTNYSNWQDAIIYQVVLLSDEVNGVIKKEFKIENPTHWDYFLFFAKQNNISMLEQMLLDGIDINLPDPKDGTTLAHNLLISKTGFSTLKWLINKGLNLHLSDYSNENSFAYSGRYQIVSKFKFYLVWNQCKNIEKELCRVCQDEDDNLWFNMINDDKNLYKIKYIVHKLGFIPSYISDDGLNSVDYSYKKKAFQISEFLQFWEKAQVNKKLHKLTKRIKYNNNESTLKINKI